MYCVYVRRCLQYKQKGNPLLQTLHHRTASDPKLLGVPFKVDANYYFYHQSDNYIFLINSFVYKMSTNSEKMSFTIVLVFKSLVLFKTHIF